VAARILVTGGAGFIGSHLVDALVAGGHSVRVLDALVPQVHGPQAEWPTWVPRDVEKLRGDVSDTGVWTRALAGVDVVYHLAAEVGVGQSMYEIARYVTANTLGTARLLDHVARGGHSIRKLIVASSMSLYGEGAYRNTKGEKVYPRLRSVALRKVGHWEMEDQSEEPLLPVPTAEDKPLYPTSIYGISKRDQEEMCLTVGRAYQLPTIALRFFNVYGPRQALGNPYTGVAAIFSSRLLNGNAPVLFEDGLQSRDFVHVKDVVEALLSCLHCDGADYEAINVGSGRALTVLDLANALIREMDVDVKPRLAYQFREGDIRHCYADITKAQELLGYQPRIMFEDGVGELVEWVRRQNAEDRTGAAAAELGARGLTR
jgi:dTDP-L-rhamnose 4-epimerase